jgi:hypothetical protein
MAKSARRLIPHFNYESFGEARYRITVWMPMNYGMHNHVRCELDYRIADVGTSNWVEDLKISGTYTDGQAIPIEVVCDPEFAEVFGEVLGYLGYVREFISMYDTKVEAPKFEVYLDFMRRLRTERALAA